MQICSVVKLWKFAITALLISHWLACAWLLVAALGDSCNNWVDSYFSTGCDGSGLAPSHLELYIAALCACPVLRASRGASADACSFPTQRTDWSVMTVATVGYGDVPPQSSAERAFATAAMLLGAAVFAFMLGSVTDVVASLNARDNEHEAALDSANAVLTEAGLSPALAGRVRDFLHRRRSAAGSPAWEALLAQLSPALRDDVALDISRHPLALVHFFAAVPDVCLAQLARVLKPQLFPPFELIISQGEAADRLFIVRHGLVVVNSYIRARDTVVGEDMLYRSGAFGYCAATLCFSELLRLNRADLEATLARFPDAAVAVRRVSARAIAREKVVAFAAAVRTARSVAARLKRKVAAEEEVAADAGPQERAAAARHMVAREVRLLSAALRNLYGAASPPLHVLLLSKADGAYAAVLHAAAARIQAAWRRWRASEQESDGGGGTLGCHFCAELRRSLGRESAHVHAGRRSGRRVPPP